MSEINIGCQGKLMLVQGLEIFASMLQPVVKKEGGRENWADWVTQGFVYILCWLVANLYMPGFLRASECLLQHD